MTNYRANVVAALESIVAIGRQLVIIDVQKCFMDSEKIVGDIIDYAKGFDEIIYIWDRIYQQSEDEYEDEYEDEDFSRQMFREMKDSAIRVRMIPIDKEYGFLRGAMDSGVSDEDIIETLRFLIKYNLADSREIINHETQGAAHAEKQKIEFVPEGFEGDDDYPDPIIYPDIDLQAIRKSPILVGGGRDECLKEIYLLLEAYNLKPEINAQYTY